MSDMKEIGIRLAIRREGDFVNAYLASQGTMDDATLIGSVLAAILEQHADIWVAWKQLMSDVVSRNVAEVFGQEPVMNERRAPESERSGRS